MKKLLLFACLSILACNLSAQTETKEELSKQLLEASGSAKMGIQMIETLVNSYKNSYPSIPEEFWTEISKEYKMDDLINLLIPIYSKYYTEEELKQLIAFYNSDIGKKVLEKTPLIMKESMQAGKDWGTKIAEKILKKMKDKGYLNTHEIER